MQSKSSKSLVVNLKIYFHKSSLDRPERGVLKYTLKLWVSMSFKQTHVKKVKRSIALVIVLMHWYPSAYINIGIVFRSRGLNNFFFSVPWNYPASFKRNVTASLFIHRDFTFWLDSVINCA